MALMHDAIFHCVERKQCVEVTGMSTLMSHASEATSSGVHRMKV